MKVFSGIFIAVVLIVNLLSPVKSLAATIELDSEDIYYESIKYLYYVCEDYFDNYGLDSNKEITKAEFLQIIFCEREGKNKSNNEIKIPFDDVKGDEDFVEALKTFLFWENIEKNEDEENLFYPDQVMTLKDGLNSILGLDHDFERNFLGPYMINDIEDKENYYLENAKKMNLFDDIEENKEEKLLLKYLARILYRLDTIKITNEKSFDESLKDRISYVNFMTDKTRKSYIRDFRDLNYILNSYYFYPEELNEGGPYASAAINLIDSLADPYTNVMDSMVFSEMPFTFDQLDLGITLKVKTVRNEEYFYVDGIDRKSFLYKEGLRKNSVITSIFDFRLPSEDNIENSEDIIWEKYLFVEYKNSFYSSQVKTIKMPIKIKDSNNLIAEILEDNILYLRIRIFEDQIIRNMEDIVKELNVFPKDINGYVLDLRGNPGGSVYSLMKIAEYLFPPNEIILQTENKWGEIKDIKTVDNPGKSNVWKRKEPWIILIDESSASASEVLVNALLDNKKDVTILGQNSYGKGKMQTTLGLPFDENLMFTMTIAKLRTPKGESTDTISIEPDIYLDLGDLFPVFDKSKDKSIQKALSILQEKLKN